MRYTKVNLRQTKEPCIPFGAVQNIAPGDGETINCTKDQCDNLYARKPRFLGDNA
jgi:hypothetical protein